MFGRLENLLHDYAALLGVLKLDMVVEELLAQLDQLVQRLSQ